MLCHLYCFFILVLFWSISSRYCEHKIKMLYYHNALQEIQTLATYAAKSFQLMGGKAPQTTWPPLNHAGQPQTPSISPNACNSPSKLGRLDKTLVHVCFSSVRLSWRCRAIFGAPQHLAHWGWDGRNWISGSIVGLMHILVYFIIFTDCDHDKYKYSPKPRARVRVPNPNCNLNPKTVSYTKIYISTNLRCET